MNPDFMQPLICVMGPTGTGKTDLVVQIAEKYPIEVLSIDSAMVYKELNIGSNKPTVAEQAVCKHHLIDLVHVQERFDVQKMIEHLQQAIVEVRSRHKVPVLVGGTMMYFYQIQHGLCEIPEFDEHDRASIYAQLENCSNQELYDALVGFDPSWAAKITSSDRQRMMRGHLVYKLTGRPLSQYFDFMKHLPYVFKNIIIDVADKQDHRVLLERRLDSMIKQGFYEEVISLFDLDPSAELPFWRFVGYRQLLAAAQGRELLEEAKQKAFFSTWQLAKRQRTWLHKFHGNRCHVTLEKGRASSETFFSVFQSILES